MGRFLEQAPITPELEQAIASYRKTFLTVATNLMGPFAPPENEMERKLQNFEKFSRKRWDEEREIRIEVDRSRSGGYSAEPGSPIIKRYLSGFFDTPVALDRITFWADRVEVRLDYPADRKPRHKYKDLLPVRKREGGVEYYQKGVDFLLGWSGATEVSFNSLNGPRFPLQPHLIEALSKLLLEVRVGWVNGSPIKLVFKEASIPPF